MKTFFKHLLIQFSILITLGVSYAAWNDIVNSGDALTATGWNDLVNKVADLDSLGFSNGNVGIGDSQSQASLQIGNTVSLFSAGTGGNLHLGGNLYYDEGSYKRMVNYNGAALVFMDHSGDISFFSNSDNNTVIDSTIIVQKNMVIKQGGNVGIGTSSPNSSLEINGYLQIQVQTSPPASDCNNLNERGRIVYDDTNNRIWVCDGSGWRYISVQ